MNNQIRFAIAIAFLAIAPFAFGQDTQNQVTQTQPSQYEGGQVVGGAVASALSGGLPLGMPPAPSDERLLTTPPEDTAAFIYWSRVGTPSATSANRTENLLANEQIQLLLNEASQSFRQLFLSSAENDPTARTVLETTDQLISTLLSRETAAYARFGERVPGPAGGLVCNLGDDVQLFKNVISGFAKMAADEVKTTSKNGLTIYQWGSFPLLRPIELTIDKQHLFIGIGPGELNAIMARFQAEKIASWLAAARHRVPVQRVANLTYVNIEPFGKVFWDLIPVPEELAPLGNNMGKSMVCVTGLDKEAVVVRTWFDVNDELGKQLKSIGGTVTEKDLEAVSLDANVTAILKLNPDALVDPLFAAMNMLEEDLAQQIQQDCRDIFDVDLRTDIFSTLGDTIQIYNSPREGGRLFTGWTGAVSLRDEKKALDLIAKFERRVNEADSDVKIKHRQFNGKKVSYLVFEGGAPVAPAWCIDNGRMIVSAFPQGIYGFLTRPPMPPSQKVLSKVTEQNASIYFKVRERTVAEHVYPILMILYSSVSSEIPEELREVVSMDIASLPPLPAITDHLDSATLTCSFDDGVEIIRHQTLPPSGIGIAAIAAAMTGALDFTSNKDLVEEKWPLEPDDESDKVSASVPGVDMTESAFNLQAAKKLAESGKHIAAIEKFQSILTDEPENTDALDGLGRSQYETKKYLDSEKTYELYVDLAPEDFRSYLGHGKAMWAQDRNEDSLLAFAHATDLNPESAESWLFRGWAHNSLKQTEKAIKYFSKTRELESSEWRATHLRGLAYFKLKQNEKALADLKIAVAQRPKHDLTRNYLAFTFFRLNQLDDAIGQMDICVNQKPLNKTYLNERADMLEDDGQYERAIRDYNAVIGLAPNDADAWKGRAGCWLEMEKYDYAIKDYSKAVELDPADKWSYSNRALCWGRKGETGNQIADHTSALKIDPKYATSLGWRASAYMDAKQYAKSKSDFTAALALEDAADDSTIISNYSWLLAACPDDTVRDGALALKLATKAADLTDWKESWIIDNIAAAHAELGDFDKAIEVAQDAIQKSDSEEERKDIQTRLDSYKKNQPARFTDS